MPIGRQSLCAVYVNRVKKMSWQGQVFRVKLLKIICAEACLIFSMRRKMTVIFLLCSHLKGCLTVFFMENMQME